MTVAELIVKLRELPQELEVLVPTEDSRYATPDRVEAFRDAQEPFVVIDFKD